MREVALPFLLLLAGGVTSVVGGVGPAWRRETPSIYSTLPENNVRVVAQSQGQTQPGENVNFYQVDQGPHPQEQPYIFQQPQPHPQEFGGFPVQQEGSFQGGQGELSSFFPQQQGFDGSNNEIQDDSGGGLLSGLMSSLLESTGIGGLLDRMNDMWNNLTGGVFGGMSRWMMGMMALPFVLPMAAIPLGVGAMALMAFPILQLTLPGIRRSFREGAVLSHSVLTSEECVERLSCNLAKKFPYDGIFSRWEKSENKWLNRVSKSVKAARTGEDCKQFSCSPVTKVQNMVRNLLGDKQQEPHPPNTTTSPLPLVVS